jgi:tight adherence protein C
MDLYIIITIVVTFALTFGLILLVFTGRTRESARLMEVTSGAQPVQGAPSRFSLASLMEGERVSKLVQPLRGLLGGSEDPELVRRLASAGYRKASYADMFYLVRLVLPILGAVGALIFIRQSTFFWIVVLAAVGFLLPDLWLTTMVSRRQDRIRLSVPDALDLLGICMEAGLGLDQAILRVGQELKISHPDLSEEFLLIGLEQRAGKPRLDAWKNMADRVGVDSVRQFVQMLVQTERFGTPVSKSLGTFADALRIRRRQQAEEMAAKTTIKMIPPLVLFIFPNLFIVLLGPAAIMIYRNLAKVLTGE